MKLIYEMAALVNSSLHFTFDCNQWFTQAVRCQLSGGVNQIYSFWLQLCWTFYPTLFFLLFFFYFNNTITKALLFFLRKIKKSTVISVKSFNLQVLWLLQSFFLNLYELFLSSLAYMGASKPCVLQFAVFRTAVFILCH